MKCDICDGKYAVRMFDGICRCESCQKAAKKDPQWSHYVKEVVTLKKDEARYQECYNLKGRKI